MQPSLELLGFQDQGCSASRLGPDAALAGQFIEAGCEQTAAQCVPVQCSKYTTS